MKLVSVNVARAELRQIGGREVLTAIGKRPVAGPVAVHLLGLEGDEQADPTVHGGVSKAVYAYSTTHYAFWQRVRAQAQVLEQVVPAAQVLRVELPGQVTQSAALYRYIKPY